MIIVITLSTDLHSAASSQAVISVIPDCIMLSVKQKFSQQNKISNASQQRRFEFLSHCSIEMQILSIRSSCDHCYHWISMCQLFQQNTL